jgi:hypothetical protein
MQQKIFKTLDNEDDFVIDENFNIFDIDFKPELPQNLKFTL